MSNDQNAKKSLIGIDLGTTYSSVTYLDDNLKPVALQNAEGQLLTPSVVYFDENGNPPIVGQEAITRSFEHPERFAEHAKRLLGDPDRCWEIDGVLYTPVDISGLIVRKLINDARRELSSIDTAVVTVPAHFSAYQRQLTIQAARQAGLEKVSIVNEPVAAALGFALSSSALGTDATVQMEYFESQHDVLVYDLGGGTFDLSVVRYDKNQLRVLAASGEERLGGIDWDQELLNMVLKTWRVVYGDPPSDRRTLRRLAHMVELAKRDLSVRDSANLKLRIGKRELEFELPRDEFEQRTAHLVERTRVLTEELLARCHLTWDDLTCILPVGGATRMPMIRRVLEGFASNRSAVLSGGNGRDWNFLRRVSPDLAVAEGAALFAGMIETRGDFVGAGAFAKTLARYSMANVTSHSLGILVRNGQGKRVNHTLIPRNAPLPATANTVVTTTQPNQRRATIRVVEGDGNGKPASVLCKCSIENLPEGLPIDSAFDLELTFDADGLLHVIAKHRDTGRLATVSTLYSPVEAG